MIRHFFLKKWDQLFKAFIRKLILSISDRFKILQFLESFQNSTELVPSHTVILQGDAVYIFKFAD